VVPAAKRQPSGPVATADRRDHPDHLIAMAVLERRGGDGRDDHAHQLLAGLVAKAHLGAFSVDRRLVDERVEIDRICRLASANARGIIASSGGGMASLVMRLGSQNRSRQPKRNVR
jgi:hypothetical protein